MKILDKVLDTPQIQSILCKTLLIQTLINRRVDTFVDRNPLIVTIIGGTIQGVRKILGATK